ncbi:EF-P beta-lysylation protein EpmB, partial [Glaesserella parasuis]|nr:EF-P beta-lysylation protein EpmB [Glaesserella parasuis]
MNISFYDAPTKAQWLQDLAESFNRPEDLLNYLELNIADFEQDLTARKLFALRVPRPFAEKMKKGDRADPLFLQ